MIPALLKVRAPGYEFELEMLIRAVRTRVALISVPIETVYIEGNQSSHFRPVVDSVRIYLVFVRFLALSGLATVLDFAVFAAAFLITQSIGWSVICGRLAAGAVSFAIEPTRGFRSSLSLGHMLYRLVLPAAVWGSIAYALILLLMERFGWGAFLSKLLVESLLVTASVVLQREVIVPRQQPLAPADRMAPSTE
jgi:hypothetical protein